MTSYPFVTRLLQLPQGWEAREALAASDGGLTFAALSDGMSRVCGWLSGPCGVQPGDRVAVCLSKSLEAAQIVYGIFASGAVHVPLQLGGPPSRLNQILRSTEPRILIAAPEMAARLTADAGFDSRIRVRVLEGAGHGGGLVRLLDGASPASPAIREADDLAVVYFTSGSSGEPKGVMLSHGNIEAGIDLVVERDGLMAEDRLISHTGLHYASLDLWFPLAVGCRSFLVSNREAMIPASIVEISERERITVLRAPVTVWRLMLESGELGRRDLRCLRLVHAFGEAMTRPLLGKLMAALPQCQFSIGFGATEAYSMASYDVPRPLAENAEPLPVGRPHREYALSLQGEAGEIRGPGNIGEVCVEGPPVMLGYWKDAALTESRRLTGRPRSWRTGDLGYLDRDGLLYLVGRRDQMVKLRGHRFELGEVEAVLKSHGDVRDAVAFAFTGASGETEIWAAVQAEPATDLTVALRRHCAWLLPRFAIPAGILRFEEFPLLSTGKLDRQSLRRLIEAARQEAGAGAP